jgi:hemerythrin
MALFAWDDIYSVGNALIDAQHRRLFDIANRFGDAFQARADRSTLLMIFDELLAYTSTHFSDEEALMRANNYPDYTTHKLNHEKLVGLVSTYRAQLISGYEGIETRIMDFLKMWLNGHILGMDRNYKPYLTAKN